MKKPTAPPELVSKKITAEIEPSSQISIKNDPKFWIALSIILGMMVILVITVGQSQYTEAQQLAGIFSGWVTSIIAFYFLGQTTQQAQSQIQTASKLQTKAEIKSDSYRNKINRIADIVKAVEATTKVTSDAEKIIQKKILDIIGSEV